MACNRHDQIENKHLIIQTLVTTDLIYLEIIEQFLHDAQRDSQEPLHALKQSRTQ